MLQRRSQPPCHKFIYLYIQHEHQVFTSFLIFSSFAALYYAHMFFYFRIPASSDCNRSKDSECHITVCTARVYELVTVYN